MDEKIKVPRWFDEWAKEVAKNHPLLAGDSESTESFIKQILINKVLQQDWARTFTGEQRSVPDPSNEASFYSEGRGEWVGNHKFKLIKAIIDGYDVEEEKGYVRMSQTNREDGSCQYTRYDNGRYFARTSYYPEANVITRSQYDDAPAWVRACKFVPVESGDEE